jgi:formylglycine-generating enzyme required for sulfatase activity
MLRGRKAQGRIWRLAVSSLAVVWLTVIGVYPVEGKPGSVFKDCSTCPVMVIMPKGSFLMGDLSGDGETSEKPVHRVDFNYSFAVGKFEVTQAEWQSVMGTNPSKYKGNDRPLENVSWRDFQKYLKELNASLGLTGRKDKYRLLSEAEWEYVARAGTKTKYHSGDTISESQARFGASKAAGTVPVGSYPPNGFGFHDVHGNVLEWVEDCWNEDYTGAPTDGSSWVQGSCSRVIRGGSWGHAPKFLRSASRARFSIGIRIITIGFRVARTLIK